MSTRINLLPHREMRRERRKKDFVGLIVLTAIGAAALAVTVALGIDQQIDTQRARNDFIRSENARLDEQIKEIASLRAEIDSLRARQQAVESLQTNRTLPVHLMDELVKHTPEGIYLKTLRQDDTRITLAGYAQSNERVSELLRNLANNTPWLERPELVEIKAARIATSSGARSNSRDAADSRRVFEFSLTAMVKVNDPNAKPPAVKTTEAAGAMVATAAGAANR